MRGAVLRKRVLPALFVLLVLGGAVALLWGPSETSIGHTVTYSDGTTLTLKGVTYGREHRYRGSGMWERLISLLPRKLAAKLALRGQQLGTGRPSVAFWFERRGTPPRTGDLVLCDASGFGISGGYTMTRLSPPDASIEGWAFEYWPRRNRTFTLRVYERGTRYPDARLIGEFTVRNPTPGTYPVWTTSLLPRTASEGDLSVTLFDLTAGVGRGSNKRKPAPNPTVSMTRAGFRVERDGMPTREWGIADVNASDATGNAITCPRNTSSEPDAEYAELQPYPWPAESAWKLRVGFSQRSNFVASELWTLHHVPLASDEPTTRLRSQTNLQGARLQYQGTARRSGLEGNHHFTFRVTPRREDYSLTLVRAVEDTGKEASVTDWFEGWGEWTFALNVSTNATSLDLTVALHRTRYFEFLATPRSFSTNEPASR